MSGAATAGVSRVLELLRAPKLEQQLAGLLLLAQQPDAATNVAAHDAVRPLLLALLRKQGDANREYQRLAVAVLASSCAGGVVLDAAFATLITPGLASLLPRAEPEWRGDVVTCLLHALQAGPQPDAHSVDGVVAWCCSADAEPEEAVLALASAIAARATLSGGQWTAMASRAAKAFAQNNSAAKADALALLLECAVRGNARVTPAMGSDVFRGATDLLCASRKPGPVMWALLQVSYACMAQLGLAWALQPSERGDFFGLLLGLVGVELSMAFDAAPETAATTAATTTASPSVLLACTNIVQLVMDQIDDETLAVRPATILALREKLADINRVAVVYAVEEEASCWHRADLATAAARLLSLWAVLDDRALTSEEVVTLMPFAVHKAHWFLEALQLWLSDDPNAAAAFSRSQGVERVCALLTAHAHTAVAGGRVVWGPVEDGCLVDPFDATVNACAILAACGCSERMSSSCIDALLRLLQALETWPDSGAATLTSFVCAALVGVLEVPGCARGAAVVSWMARFAPRAPALEAVSVLQRLVSIVRGRDLYGLRGALHSVQPVLRAVLASADTAQDARECIVALLNKTT